MKVSKQLKQAFEIMDFAHSAALALRDSLLRDGKMTITREDAAAIRALVQSWRDAQERVSFHRRVPAPSVREKEKRQSKSSWSRPGFGGLEQVREASK